MKRVQLSRAKGWRMPPNTVSVARPTQWGNPWRVARDGDAAYCVEQYRRCILDLPVDAWPQSDLDQFVANRLLRPSVGVVWFCLAGKNLACWCRLDAPCHGDVLLEIAANAVTMAGFPPSARAPHRKRRRFR
jgi:hypothetical protein